jgi:hypothetical protein
LEFWRERRVAQAVIGVAEMVNHLAEMANDFRWREDIGSPILRFVPTTSQNHFPIVLIDKIKNLQTT